jgi:hypothetical protein
MAAPTTAGAEKTMNRRFVFLSLVIFASGALLGFGLKSVSADGIPTSDPLFYSGTLTENGQLVQTPRQLTVNLWSGAMPQPGEVALCSTSVPSTPVLDGRFRVALDPACKTALNAHPDAYAEIVVDGTTSLGRLKVGAVPYSIEADHAVRASQAETAAGASSFNVSGNLAVGGAATFNTGATFGGATALNGKTVFGKGSGLAASTPIAYGMGGYPRTGKFSSSGGALLLLASASAWASSASIMRIDVVLDGKAVGSLFGFTNEPASHKALAGNPIILTGVGAGDHTVTLTLVAGNGDYNDYSAVSVVELPL